jgi:hypothetical protein
MEKSTASNILSLFAGFVCLLFCISSCTNDEVNGDDQSCDEVVCNEADSIYQDRAVCDLDFIASYNGTACCLSGPVKVNPGESLSYEYHSNIPNAKITWEVICGSIELTDGQNTQTAKFKFGDDFTTGCIQALGENERICSESFSISKKSAD